MTQSRRTIRLTDVARELIAAGLHGEQLLDAMGRIEDRVLSEVTAIKAERTTPKTNGTERVINRPSLPEPGVDEIHD